MGFLNRCFSVVANPMRSGRITAIASSLPGSQDQFLVPPPALSRLKGLLERVEGAGPEPVEGCQPASARSPWWGFIARFIPKRPGNGHPPGHSSFRIERTKDGIATLRSM